MTGNSGHRPVKTVETAFDVLDAIQRLDGAGVTEIAGEDVVSQAEQAFDNIEILLAEIDCELSDVKKVTTSSIRPNGWRTIRRSTTILSMPNRIRVTRSSASSHSRWKRF